ncbi:23S rRNA (uracil(1939)-C(5))-methyltransferase RlmD [Algoriphagus aquimarinus]|uniref:23S rRNA m(5)U-1939 methyltransferase n=1 Tax=Algoriphagus aquimarinus TaxID=237018 RepID=A0A1I0Z3Z6_9BACT|nr:23S rRNA (uracil(1939)-C(5))-methyltransferase RlmD [Algoriphagus aquimarinus]SFB19158.1 23S rRNA m(5)U-1939 methyltransferase [Algoriphagus aquimarinus]|tara:strand:- start:96176 stop:97582 length:1407 start_codon:yes stop_codon:yes gene_type:complete
MSRKMKNKVITNLLIERIASEGKCLGHHEEKVVFVTGVAPGDVVDVRITKGKSSFMEGEPVNFHEYSKERIDPFCSHFGTCGGCKWQHINYDLQKTYKRQQVLDQFQRIAKVEIPEVMPTLGSEKTRYYRNKLDFTFSNKKWLTVEQIQSGEDFDRSALGFHIPKMFDKIVDVDHCYLQGNISNDVRNELRTFALANGLTFYDIRGQVGLLRNLIIRTTSTEQSMVIVQFGEDDPEGIQKVMEFLNEKFPQITSLLYVINTKGNETFHDLDLVTFSGNDFIEEEMEGLRFRIGPKSFYQTNSEQAYELYKVARDFADLQGDEVVYDLYTGTGTIANFVAKKAKQVIGIEYVPAAIEDAKINSQINGIDNTLFYAGDMKDMLNDEFIANHAAPDLIITDPPRAGMDEKVVQMLLRLNAPKIVYVSCNPATQARDVALLSEKYKVEKIQPVDMFPQTYHVENVVLLTLKS